MPKTIYLAVSLDVEEEGLFRGVYAQKDVTVTNTGSLPKLIPLLREGIRPTLFCAHAVLQDQRSREILADLRDTWGAEIGAHLHHWNTPPLDPRNRDRGPLSHVPSDELSTDLFARKLESVLSLGCDFQKRPLTSFRMGRWDIHQKHWPVLARLGILTDASVRPLHGKRQGSSGPDHYSATSMPYWIRTDRGTVFEVPLTVTPILSVVPGIFSFFERRPEVIARICAYLKSTMNYWGALALLPCYHPLWAMEAVTALYIRRGGTLLSLTWHSSEMHPNATPHLPTERHVQALLSKVHNYIRWLKRHWHVVCLPMNELRNTLGPAAPIRTCRHGEDWSVAETATELTHA